MRVKERRGAVTPALDRPAWATHPETAEVTTEWLIATARAAPSWCGRGSPTRPRTWRGPHRAMQESA